MHFPLHQMFHGDFGAGVTLRFQPRASQFAPPGLEDAEQSPLPHWLFPFPREFSLPGGDGQCGAHPGSLGMGISAGMGERSCSQARGEIPDVGIASQHCENTQGGLSLGKNTFKSQ